MANAPLALFIRVSEEAAKRATDFLERERQRTSPVGTACCPLPSVATMPFLKCCSSVTTSRYRRAFSPCSRPADAPSRCIRSIRWKPRPPRRLAGPVSSGCPRSPGNATRTDARACRPARPGSALATACRMADPANSGRRGRHIPVKPIDKWRQRAVAREDRAVTSERPYQSPQLPIEIYGARRQWPARSG